MKDHDNNQNQNNFYRKGRQEREEFLIFLCTLGVLCGKFLSLVIHKDSLKIENITFDF